MNELVNGNLHASFTRFSISPIFLLLLVSWEAILNLFKRARFFKKKMLWCLKGHDDFLRLLVLEKCFSLVKIRAWHSLFIWTTEGVEGSICKGEARDLTVTVSPPLQAQNSSRNGWAGTLAILTFLVFKWKGRETSVPKWTEEPLYIGR